MANIERLRKLHQYLFEHPQEFNYSEWIIGADGHKAITTFALSNELNKHECGTIGCVAGHAAIMAMNENFEPQCTYIDDLARHYLDLSIEEARFLFLGHAGYLYDEWYPELCVTDPQVATVEEAIRRIEIIIEHHTQPIRR